MRWHKVRNKGYEKMKREELHKLLFETLCIIDDICKKENVRWFLVSGTEYGMLAEGDSGELTFQGTRYLNFRREGAE